MGKHTTPAAPAVDSYARITSRILADLEQDVRPWVKPWTTGAGNSRVTCPLRATGEPCTGINVLLLRMEAVSAGHSSPTWMTYKQAQALAAARETAPIEAAEPLSHLHQPSGGAPRRGGSASSNGTENPHKACVSRLGVGM